MLQILQSLANGETMLAEGPAPGVGRGRLLIGNRASVVSIGTERMLMDFGKANLLQKARQQPDKVRQVIAKIRTDGLLPALEAVRAKLDQPIALGYSSAGTVLAVGEGVEGFAVGDRVASNGPHAEVVCVPANLCARIPDGVGFEQAAFTVVASIALQGIRLANPTLGEAVGVLGLGLIGQLTVQLLRAQGCRVLGMDFDTSRCALARQFGAETVDLSKAEDPVAAGMAFSRGRGMDAVLITAATKSNDPVHQAAQMSRKRGRIVLVGVVGLELSRADFYEKELTFQVSCSYGPGRYDNAYEQKGLDYPIGFVRWTEGRNFEAVLDMMASGALDTDALITHRFAFERALEAYGQVASGGALGMVLEYPAASERSLARTVDLRDGAMRAGAIRELPLQDAGTVAGPVVPDAEAEGATPGVDATRAGAMRAGAIRELPLQGSVRRSPVQNEVRVAVIGAGGFTGQVLLPALKKAGADLRTICSSGGTTAAHLGRKFGFAQATTDAASVLADPSVNTIVITTRHNTHARYVREALRAGKRVYVEKPLCLTREELAAIEADMRDGSSPFLMVGFNRRFSPLAAKTRDLLGSLNEPRTLVMMVNAGEVPPDHWTQDPEEGGGRIIGEGCHFIDLLRYIVGAPIVDVQSAMLRDGQGLREDRMTFTLLFADGSLGTVHYFANGSKAFPKERLEAFCAGRVLQLDNWRRLTGFGWPGFRSMRLRRQDKGHAAEMRALVDAVRAGTSSPIPFEETAEVTRASFDVVEAARRLM